MPNSKKKKKPTRVQLLGRDVLALDFSTYSSLADMAGIIGGRASIDEFDELVCTAVGEWVTRVVALPPSWAEADKQLVREHREALSALQDAKVNLQQHEANKHVCLFEKVRSVMQEADDARCASTSPLTPA